MQCPYTHTIAVFPEHHSFNVFLSIKSSSLTLDSTQRLWYTYCMKAIITVVGGDRVGIIAKVSAYLAQHSINIDDITQTILSGNFVMMMMTDFSNADTDIDSIRKELAEVCKDMGVEVNVMNEKVFSTMHRI